MKTATLFRRPMPWRALCVPAAMVMAATVPGTAAQSAPRQDSTVTGNIVFQIMDYEAFGRNERCRHDIPIVNHNVTDRYSYHWYFAKCGGEIRIEVHYGIRRNSYGTVGASGVVKIFEGTSENTKDQDGWTSLSLDVSPGQTGTVNIHVYNQSEEQPDDKADVAFTLHN